MNSKKQRLLRENEAIAIIVGSMIGIGFLSVPNAVAQDTKQDGWIAVILGAVYPLILAFVAGYLSKIHPKENILDLNKRYFGIIASKVLNSIFLLRFIFYVPFVTAGLIAVLRLYAVPFLSPLKLFIPSMLILIYINEKGINALRTINIISFYLIITLSLFLLGAFNGGSYLNFMPIISSSLNNIIKTMIKLTYHYGGMEMIFLLYPKFQDNDKVLRIALKSTFIVMFIYLFNEVSCISFLGYKICEKSLWPVLLIVESIQLPLLNTSRYLFLIFWSIIVFKRMANEYYAVSFIIESTFNKKAVRIFYLLSFPIFLYASTNVTNTWRRKLLYSVIPVFAVMNITYSIFICLFIFLKNRKK